jgi:hypothetical protein
MDEDGQALRLIMNVEIPNLRGKVSTLEMGLGEVRGMSERNEKELKAVSIALARIEGKLDRALR